MGKFIFHHVDNFFRLPLEFLFICILFQWIINVFVFKSICYRENKCASEYSNKLFYHIYDQFNP